MNLLTSEEIKALGQSVPYWSRRGAKISRRYLFNDFKQALKFVNLVGKIAEDAQHHPDIDIRWNKVRLTLTTHDEGGLTQDDFELAEECDLLLETLALK